MSAITGGQSSSPRAFAWHRPLTVFSRRSTLLDVRPNITPRHLIASASCSPHYTPQRRQQQLQTRFHLLTYTLHRRPLAAPNRRPEILFRRFLDSEFPAAAPHDLIACSARLPPNNHTASARPSSRCGRSLSVPALLDLYSKICREAPTTFETLRVMRDAQCVTRD